MTRYTQRTLMLPALGILVASLAMGGCSRREDLSAAGPNSNDTVVAQTERTARDQQTDGSRAMSDAKEANTNATATTQAAPDTPASSGTAQQASDKITDALITTSVNAELAKDKTLSATKIDVDTDAGRVALRGTAPNETAKDRATQLASNVKGVVNVDNQLTIQGANM